MNTNSPYDNPGCIGKLERNKRTKVFLNHLRYGKHVESSCFALNYLLQQDGIDFVPEKDLYNAELASPKRHYIAAYTQSRDPCDNINQIRDGQGKKIFDYHVSH